MIAEKTFRQDYVKDLPIRSIDIVAHCLIGFVVSYLIMQKISILAMALQWLPDIALPILFMRSIFTGKYAPDGDGILLGHRILHHRYTADIALLWGLLLINRWTLLIGVQWLTHWIIDSYTHKEGWQ